MRERGDACAIKRAGDQRREGGRTRHRREVENGIPRSPAPRGEALAAALEHDALRRVVWHRATAAVAGVAGIGLPPRGADRRLRLGDVSVESRGATADPGVRSRRVVKARHGDVDVQLVDAQRVAGWTVALLHQHCRQIVHGRRVTNQEAPPTPTRVVVVITAAAWRIGAQQSSERRRRRPGQPHVLAVGSAAIFTGVLRRVDG